MQASLWRLEPVADEDFEAMLSLRMAALRESLERLGRYDLARGRARLREGFEPAWMRHIVLGDERIGFFTLKPQSGALHLNHLYLKPARQGQGSGAWVMAQIKAQARAQGLAVTLSALKLSDANRFYLRHGFRQVAEHEFDLDYRWQPAGEPVQAGA
ncbi:GNAT family N-acetyltransferase [Roseateles koreensis]|uniref:GNAT family N-acetyltransferase n=1 Tax=Roseateles koreensis TaxID=2987526 RepID=A0ABT5KWN1_9BURK|nr:GNAT family N-acetyltransferase [Roseateles koreensis]MDC8786231.1 GNAT family N-acetyltransferase [Roseateles koreensis]